MNYITLCKGERGLGFSLIDYQQDPFNPLSKTMIVIRALVPNGVAQLDGRLMPGQRLVSIDEAILDEDLLLPPPSSSAATSDKEKSNSSLNQLHHSTGSISKLSAAPVPVVDLLKYTVDLLKAIPVGKPVRLGVQKPLPYPDAEIDSQAEDVEMMMTTTTTTMDAVATVTTDSADHEVPIKTTKDSSLVRRPSKLKDTSKSSRSYHSLHHTTAATTTTSTNVTPVAKKRKQTKSKMTKKKVN